MVTVKNVTAPHLQARVRAVKAIERLREAVAGSEPWETIFACERVVGSALLDLEAQNYRRTDAAHDPAPGHARA